jgi:hypothetical protein
LMACTRSSRVIASGALITHQARVHQSRVVLILVPASGIAEDVFADSVEAGFKPASTSFHRFMVIALPDGMEVGVCQEPFRHADFEPADD